MSNLLVLPDSGGFIVQSPDVPFYSGGATEYDALYNFAADLKDHIESAIKAGEFA